MPLAAMRGPLMRRTLAKAPPLCNAPDRAGPAAGCYGDARPVTPLDQARHDKSLAERRDRFAHGARAHHGPLFARDGGGQAPLGGLRVSFAKRGGQWWVVRIEAEN